MVKIKFLGGCREIGAASVLIQSENNVGSLLLDYGIRLNQNENVTPEKLGDIKLSAVALSHCHIDHSGGLPNLYNNGSVPLFTTELNYRIVTVLIRDMFKIAKQQIPFSNKELNKMGVSTYFLGYDTKQRIDKNFYITLKNAGHVPGSSCILVEVDGKKILYTGDFNTINTRLVNGIDMANFQDKLDAVIIESTYALREHEAREKIEKDFIEKVNIIVENKGKVLVPAFGVGRSQEILSVLYTYGYRGHLFLDGMARRISEMYFDYSEYLRNPREFQKAVNNSTFILNSRLERDRRIAKKTPGVIISPSGMLQGGPARNYAKSIINDPNSAIFSVGYQVENTPGRILLDENRFLLTKEDKKGINADCHVQNFDFSSHAGASGIRNFVDNLIFKESSNKTVLSFHGDTESCTNLAKDLNKKGYSAISPENGDIFTI